MKDKVDILDPRVINSRYGHCGRKEGDQEMGQVAIAAPGR